MKSALLTLALDHLDYSSLDSIESVRHKGFFYCGDSYHS